MTGVLQYLVQFERTTTKERILQPTPKSLKEAKAKGSEQKHQENLEPLVEGYRKEQRDCGGEYQVSIEEVTKTSLIRTT
jgi:hypothetical protein